MATLDISQRAPQRHLEAKAVEAMAIFTDAAERTTAAWKAAGRPKDQGDGSYAQPHNPKLMVAFEDFLRTIDEKQEAYLKWQRAASAHGHSLMPKSTTQET